jgi:DNA-binding IclR family transcriptional regulator
LEGHGLVERDHLRLVYVDEVEAPQNMALNWLGKSVPLEATSAGEIEALLP